MVHGAIQLVKFISLDEDIEDMFTSFSDAIKEINVLSDKRRFKKILIVWKEQ